MDYNKALFLYSNFIDSTRYDDFNYRLTVASETSPYATCFAFFGYALLKTIDNIEASKTELSLTLINNLKAYHHNHNKSLKELLVDKPFLQLLTFTLSAISTINSMNKYNFSEYIEPLLDELDIISYLYEIGTFDGKPGSGNFAMFIAILLIHARDYIGLNKQKQIDDWCEVHLKNMNCFGFWGDSRTMSHLQFQNGYHQYEILDYLGVDNPKSNIAADFVASLADEDGHFAPYPGGGGCYDYDAVSILTSSGQDVIEKHRDLLIRTSNSILNEQNSDGGFCESQRVRPRSIENLTRSFRHIVNSTGIARYERLRYALALLLPKNDLIHTHWSLYSRRWNESDLWDSWFRMMTIARIDVALNPHRASNWGFINYPGIGYHQSLKKIE